MAKIRIRKKHTESKEAARKKVEASIAPHVAKFGLKQTWDGDTLRVSGKGLDGTLVVGDGDVDIDMNLGMPASLVASKIESELNAELNRSFS